MKIGKLKEILNDVDDDLEIYTSPLFEIDVLDDDLSNPSKPMVPNPLKRYELVEVAQTGSVGPKGVYDLCLILCYDDSVNFGTESRDSSETEEFIN